MSQQIAEVPLSGTEEAFFALVIDRYRTMLQQVEQVKAEALTILYAEKGIPAGAHIGIIARTESSPALLTYAVEVADAHADPAPETLPDTAVDAAVTEILPPVTE